MDIKLTRNGNDLCYESYYGTYFRSSYSALLETMYNMNGRFTFDGRLDMDQVYKSLDLAPPDGSNGIGWDAEFFVVEYEKPSWIDFFVSTTVAPNGEPCITLNYVTEPIFLDKWDEFVEKNY